MALWRKHHHLKKKHKPLVGVFTNPVQLGWLNKYLSGPGNQIRRLSNKTAVMHQQPGVKIMTQVTWPISQVRGEMQAIHIPLTMWCKHLTIFRRPSEALRRCFKMLARTSLLGRHFDWKDHACHETKGIFWGRHLTYIQKFALGCYCKLANKDPPSSK